MRALSVPLIVAVCVTVACVTSKDPPRASGQSGDASFEFPDIGEPAFTQGAGPRVDIVGTHHNYHTAIGRYRAFAEILGLESSRRERPVRHGQGRVAVFGEAAQFSAQISGTGARPMGMNHPNAPHNARFLLDVMVWLADGA